MRKPNSYLPRLSIAADGLARELRVRPDGTFPLSAFENSLVLGSEEGQATESEPGTEPDVSTVREQLTLPVASAAAITDEMLFESADGTTHFFLPRYKLAEQIVSGKPQFKVELVADGSGGSLTVYLAAYPAPELGEQSRDAQPVAHDLALLLRYGVPTGGGSAQEELIFQEVTTNAGEVRAVLQVEGLSKFTQLSAAISDSRYNAALIVRRTIRVAIPDPNGQPRMPVLSSGTLTIPPGSFADLDTGVVGDSGDIWWHPDNAQRRLSPQNGAQIADINRLDLTGLTPAILFGLGHGVTGLENEPTYTGNDLHGIGFRDANAVLLVTPNWNPNGSGGIYNNHPIGVWFDGHNWQIYNQDIGSLDGGNAFNIKMPTPGLNVYVHHATSANISGNYTDIDHQLSNGNPNAILMVTPNWNPGGVGGVYNNHPIGVWYNTGTARWSIYNQDLQPMPEGAAFNVEFLTPNESTFVHRASAANSLGDYTDIDHPLCNGNNGVMVMVTPNWNPGGTGGVYNNHAIGVWYNSGTGRWSIFNQDLQPVPEGATFNIEILKPESQAFVHFVEAGQQGNHCTVISASDDGMLRQYHSFAVRTDAGNYGVFRIEDDSGPLSLTWATYQGPAWPYGTPLFQPIEQSLDSELAPQPFAFSPTLQPYIFRGLGGQTNSNYGFIQRSVQWNKRFFSYYQDEARPHVFKYLPDSFKIARRSTSPYYPSMAVGINEDASGGDASVVSLDYRAAPYVDRARLAAAASSLRAQFSQNGQELVFEPLLPGPDSTRLLLRRPGAGIQEHSRAVVDLREGIDDSMTLPLAEFQEIFDVLCGGSSFFDGWVEIKAGSTLERVPFLPRFQDLVGDLFDVEYHLEAPAGPLGLTLHNAIESPLRIKALPATVRRGAATTSGALQQPALPLELAPGASTEAVFALAQPLDGTGELEVDLDLSQVEVALDTAAVLQAVLRTQGMVSARQINVRALPVLFEQPAGAPDQQVLRIVVDFEHGDSVELAPDQLTAQSIVRYPIKDYLLSRSNDGQYRYWVKVYRRVGQPTREERVDTTTKLIVIL